MNERVHRLRVVWPLAWSSGGAAALLLGSMWLARAGPHQPLNARIGRALHCSRRPGQQGGAAAGRGARSTEAGGWVSVPCRSLCRPAAEHHQQQQLARLVSCKPQQRGMRSTSSTRSLRALRERCERSPSIRRAQLAPSSSIAAACTRPPAVTTPPATPAAMSSSAAGGGPGRGAGGTLKASPPWLLQRPPGAQGAGHVAGPRAAWGARGRRSAAAASSLRHPPPARHLLLPAEHPARQAPHRCRRCGGRR